MRSVDLLLASEGAGVAPGDRGRAWTVVIAEDLAEHAEHLVDCLKRLRPAWTVAAVVSEVGAVLEAIDQHVPNLLLLDVHLEGGKSFEIIDRIPYPLPVIFTTGDPAHAASAYDCAAVDYVLKPVRPARLERALIRAEAAAQRSAPAAASAPDAASAGWLVAMRGAGQAIIHYRDVLYLQARGKLTLVATAEGDAFIKRGLGVVEMNLRHPRFKRIHRGTIVNIDHAQKVMRDDLGRMRLSVRRRDEWLDVSQAYEHLFRPT